MSLTTMTRRSWIVFETCWRFPMFIFSGSSNIVQPLDLIPNPQFQRQNRKVFALPHVAALQPLIHYVHLGALQCWDERSHLARGNHSPSPDGDDLCFSVAFEQRPKSGDCFTCLRQDSVNYILSICITYHYIRFLIFSIYAYLAALSIFSDWHKKTRF